MTRGQRNHNPLNIRRSSTRWKGQAAQQNDPEFVQFISDVMGYRAAFRVLRTYMNCYCLHTVTQIIRRWAPPEDGNETSAYIYMVCRLASLGPGEYIAFTDRDKMVRLVRAMARVESCIEHAPQSVLEQAYSLV